MKLRNNDSEGDYVFEIPLVAWLNRVDALVSMHLIPNDAGQIRSESRRLYGSNQP